MGSTLKIFILLCGIFSVAVVLHLLVKRRINERNSLFWLASALVILAFSTMPEILNILARLTGVDYPPTLLFLLSSLILLFMTLYQSIQISVLQERLKELTQHVAINQEREIPSEK